MSGRLLNMKFMARSKEVAKRQELEREQKRVDDESKWVIGNGAAASPSSASQSTVGKSGFTGKGRRTVHYEASFTAFTANDDGDDDRTVPLDVAVTAAATTAAATLYDDASLIGRHSFQNFNTEVDRLKRAAAEAKRAAVHPPSSTTASSYETSATDMSFTHKRYSSIRPAESATAIGDLKIEDGSASSATAGRVAPMHARSFDERGVPVQKKDKKKRALPLTGRVDEEQRATKSARMDEAVEISLRQKAAKSAPAFRKPK